MTAIPTPFTGIIPPVATPFTEDGEVDVASLERLIAFQLDAGVHALFMLGSTSETAILTNAQKATVLDVAVRTAGRLVPILAGVIETATGRVIELAREAKRLGVDGLIVTAPFYIRPSQDEIVAHFRAIRAAVDLPILAYDIPSAVQTKLARPTVARLAEEGLIVGLKDSSGDSDNFRGVILDTRRFPGFAAFTGSELLVDSALLIGAAGSVPGLCNVDPVGYVRIYDSFRAGDLETARLEQERLYGLFSIITPGLGRMGSTASALGGFKSALMLRGVIATNVMGQPMTRYDESEVAAVRRILQETGLL